MTEYDKIKSELPRSPKRWLVTGAAGFIGSNLVETLLGLEQVVIGFDNFSTGKRANLDHIRASVTPQQWERFVFMEGDICDLSACRRACCDANYVLHQAALGSVPRSIEDPLNSHHSNVTGFINMLVSARDAGVIRFVFASSSSIYGDEPNLPKVENRIGAPLSPYAATKWMNEIYAAVFARNYSLETIGLRYFNVFGPRQDPAGAYAAVIPKWVAAMLKGEPVHINGDGETSRDFCYVANVVQVNILAATTLNPEAVNRCYNVAVGARTSLNQLHQVIKSKLVDARPGLVIDAPQHRNFREGDVRHSLADISLACGLLGYKPTHDVEHGMDEALDWYLKNVQNF